MGHGQEIGIIPRFCAELFTRADHEVTRDSEMVSAQICISAEILQFVSHSMCISIKSKKVMVCM